MICYKDGREVFFFLLKRSLRNLLPSSSESTDPTAPFPLALSLSPFLPSLEDARPLPLRLLRRRRSSRPHQSKTFTLSFPHRRGKLTTLSRLLVAHLLPSRLVPSLFPLRQTPHGCDSALLLHLGRSLLLARSAPTVLGDSSVGVFHRRDVSLGLFQQDREDALVGFRVSNISLYTCPSLSSEADLWISWGCL